MVTPSHHPHSAAMKPAIAVALCLGTAGCGAGQQTQTADQVAAVNGSNIAAAPIALRNVYLDVDPAAPHPIQLVFTAVNTSDLTPDRLVSITSETATVTLSGAAAPGLTRAFTFTFARAGAITAEVPFDVVTPGEPVPAGRGALSDPV